MSKIKKYYIRTFGCQMNYSDSERFADVMNQIGYIPSNNYNDSDLVIFNTCSVKQQAEDRILGLKKKMDLLKRKNSDLKIILTGCMAKRSWKIDTHVNMQVKWEKVLMKRMPWLDWIIETKDFTKLPALLGIDIKIKPNPEDYLSLHPIYKNKFQAYVPISTGCDHFCTFCIVPYARGSEICRPYEDIYSEVLNLVEKGYKDISLLGQTVNRWINPKFDSEYPKTAGATYIKGLNENNLINKENESKDFLQLLQKIDLIKGDWWFNFMSSHPNYMTKELIKFLAVSKHFRPSIHFAMQSGSDKILKRMNRRHNISEFIEKVKLIREIVPNVSITTDVIVGFPGETQGDFEETIKVMQELEFDLAFISEFSSRKGTTASIIDDDVSHTEKERRKKYLNDEILAKSALKQNNKLLNQIIKSLVERIDNKGHIVARTLNYKEVIITNSDDENLIGQFVNIKITKVSPWKVWGEIVG